MYVCVPEIKSETVSTFLLCRATVLQIIPAFCEINATLLFISAVYRWSNKLHTCFIETCFSFFFMHHQSVSFSKSISFQLRRWILQFWEITRPKTDSKWLKFKLMANIVCFRQIMKSECLDCEILNFFGDCSYCFCVLLA